MKATRLLRIRAGLEGRIARAVSLVAALVCGLFVAIVLADPTSSTRGVLEGGVQRFGVVPVLLAGALLAGGTYLVARGRDPERTADVEPGERS